MGKQKSQQKQSAKGLQSLAQLKSLSSEVELPSDRDNSSDESWEMPSGKQIPLQVLKLDDFVQGHEFYQRMKEEERTKTVLKNTATADKDWEPLYTGLCDRIKSLAATLGADNTGNVQRAIVVAEFPGYTRVGGFPGFWERLLPVMHPVYGIPYVPASSIKGVLRAWARHMKQPNIDYLLGYLDSKKAAIAAVEILDAFPMKPCLKVDVATPQWSWEGEEVTYGPSPHPLLSLEKLQLQIGLCQTSRGKLNDVKIVMGWLEDALLTDGLGSRVSAGYGRASKANTKTTPTIKPIHLSRHRFEFWSQGMYGITPPSKENNYTGETEFRATAVRGILRFWFRAVALGVFPPAQCQVLEHLLFGTLEPKARNGHTRISISYLEETPGDKETPHKASGAIVLEAKTQEELTLLQYLLRLATHLGGVGRGSRRPLHINQDGNRRDLRGCYWQLTEKEMQLASDPVAWNALLNDLRSVLRVVKDQAFAGLKPEELQHLQQFHRMAPGSPGDSRRGNRRQDVLNSNARIYLLKTSVMKLPSQSGWDAPRNRGAALEFLYTSGYKGVNQVDQGTAEVGGKLETPSFVWITSNYLQDSAQAYQVITVFGADQDDRAQFCRALKGKYQAPILTEIQP